MAFTITIFLGAALLFMVQPMAAKLVLPLLGGSPSVWNTCMVFFQALLLAGYAYAHWSVRVLGLRRQVLLHLAVVAAPAVLWCFGWPPLGKPGAGPAEGQGPVVWLLGSLVVTVGPAFFVLSTCGTLMQRWFAATGHAGAKDPYFLYAASNAGSMLALLSYPLMLEPWLRLGEQRWAWSAGFLVFAAATACCAVCVRRSGRTQKDLMVGGVDEADRVGPAWKQRLRWVVLSMVPSSLMLAVTQYLSTDIAAVPLLWVVPLGLYLLTFILAFAGRWTVPLRVCDRSLPILVLSLVAIVLLGRHDPIWIIMILNLAALFFGAMLCHGRLAASRPPAAHLTTFYMCIATGGVLGGVFNAIVAPMVFDALLEYPIAIAAVCLLRPPDPGPRASAWKRVTDLGFAMLPVAVMLLVQVVVRRVASPGWASNPPGEYVKLGCEVGVPVLLCYLLVGGRVRFAAAVLGLLLVEAAQLSRSSEHQARTFFGLYSVYRSRTPGGFDAVELRHGTTLHGSQWEDPARRNEPLAYYHRLGPVGDVFSTHGHTALFDRVGVVGLGTGSIASYGRAGQSMRFFEIDPEVVWMSGPGGYFRFLEDSNADVSTVLGDARLSVAKEADGSFGAIFLDAFSSDAVPVHLLTTEAVSVYLSKLKPRGIIAFHVSNRYLDLERVVRGVAGQLGLVVATRNDTVDEAVARKTLHQSSTWMVVARSREDLVPFLSRPAWEESPRRPGDVVWTDDYSSFIGVFRWSDPP